MSEITHRRALKPDAQAFDEVRIVTVPRWKTSGLSGDEWRISATVEFYRKGRLVHEAGPYRNVQTACGCLYAAHASAIDDGKGCFAGEGYACDQEGCAEPATVLMRLKREFCHAGHETDPYRYDTTPLVRRFCDTHKTRGDGALEDADRNYETLPEFVESTPA